jgi:hypothetical protein
MSYTYEAEVSEALRLLTHRLETEIPEMGEVLKEARAEGASEHEVMRRAMAVVLADPSLGARMEALAMEAFAPLRGEVVKVEQPTAPEIIVEAPFGVGRPRLNPHYEAAVYERLSFDGDAPEIRTGALPEGGTPAVPVDTDARNPVALGWMLETAAAEVAREMRQIEGSRIEEVQAFIDDVEQTDAALVARGPEALQKLNKDTLPDPEGYKRGQLPQRRSVEEPDGGDLVMLTSEQRGQLAWKFLSTTQGRRSATRAIRELVHTKLRSDGHAVMFGDEEPGRVARPEDVLVHATWTVELSGRNATQSSFAFVDTAAQVLAHKLETELDEGEGAGAKLEVIPVNTVEVRKVGWAARLVRDAR